MLTTIKQVLLGTLVFSVLAFGAVEAKADYVCKVSYRPENGGKGTDGYLFMTSYAGPSCTGDYRGSAYICTTGATFTNCSANAAHRYERQGILTTFRALQQAALMDMHITLGTTACPSGATDCVSWINFSSE